MIDAADLFEDAAIGKQFMSSFDEMERVEVVQLLSDLGYIPLEAFEDDEVSPDELKTGIDLFQQELKQALAEPDQSNLDEIYQASASLLNTSQEGTLNERELHVLKEITGLDQEFILEEVAEDQINLFTRVVLYRYRVYGLTTFPPGEVFGSKVLDQLLFITEKLGFEGTLTEISNLLANQLALSDYAVNNATLANQMEGTCIFFDLSTKAVKDTIANLGKQVRQKKQFLENLGHEKVKGILEQYLNTKDHVAVSRGVQTTIDTSDKNKFMLRMLQVKLWVMGIYQSRLDDELGPKSILALNDFLVSIAENDEDGQAELGNVLYHLPTSQCALNIRYLIEAHILPIESAEVQNQQSSISRIFELVLEDKTKTEGLTDAEKGKIKDQSDTLSSRLQSELTLESERIIDKTQKKVRQYKARKGLLKLVSKFWTWVDDSFQGLIKLFKKLLQYLAKATKHIFREVGEAFQKFKKGLTFLFGQRKIQPTEHIQTDYDFDFDGLTRVSSRATAEDIQTHVASLKTYAAALYPTLHFTRIVIQWGIRAASGPVGWTKILLGMARLLKEVVANRASGQEWALNN